MTAKLNPRTARTHLQAFHFGGLPESFAVITA